MLPGDRVGVLGDHLGLLGALLGLLGALWGFLELDWDFLGFTWGLVEFTWGLFGLTAHTHMRTRTRTHPRRGRGGSISYSGNQTGGIPNIVCPHRVSVNKAWPKIIFRVTVTVGGLISSELRVWHSWA